MKKESISEGFTLLELLIAVVIVGILSAISFSSYLSFVNKSKYSTAQGQMNMMGKELKVFKLENGYYPADVNRDITPKDNNNQPAIKNFYAQSSGKIPFNSKYDYEHWQVGSLCQIRISFLGEDVEKDSVTMSQTTINTWQEAGFYEAGDDLIYVIDTFACD